jgi:ssDNA-binding Zn-finger/Zn-ribbon topoisomerase 1
MARPYVSWPIERLESIFESEGGDQAVHSQLKEELSFRTTRRALRLLARVNERIADLDTEEPAESEGDVEGTGFDEGDADEATPSFNDPQSYGEEPPGSSGGESADREQPPDDRRRPQILSTIRPVGTSGLPPPWIRPLDGNLSLHVPGEVDLPQLYATAISALIAEIKRTGAGQKRYELENGIRVEGKAGEMVYEFAFTDEVGLFEDAKVEVELPGRRVEASIVSISSGRLWLSTKEDLGTILHRAVIVIDATALLEALREKVEQAARGEVAFTRDFADAVVGRRTHPPDPAPIPRALSEIKLNHAQVKALEKALTASITYIWGPPGCGKTHVLGEVVRSTFEGGKRILICSNTNKAVDQVLFKVCESLSVGHPAMEEGRIVRLGQVTYDKLKEYEAYVTVDGIVERKAAELKVLLSRVQEKIARIDTQTAKARGTLGRFAELDSAQRSVETQKEATNKLAQSGRELKVKHETILSRITGLETELRKPKGGLFGWFKRSEEAIKRDIVVEQERLATVSAEIDKTKASYAEAKGRFEAAKARLDQIVEGLAGFDRGAAEQEIAKADVARAPLVEQLRVIEAQIADVRAAVLRDAKVLGATCTKTYLAAKEIGQVDLVIIDEASMVLLPMVWFAAGIAKERVVVCGDFRQIPPIVQTREQAIFDVLGDDVFHAARLDKFEKNDTRMVKLDLQYRMDHEICQLISTPMYRELGGLRTADEVFRRAKTQRPPPPYDQTLTIVDTSDLWPFESVNAYFSRFNLMHALLVRNLAWHFRQRRYVQRPEDLAVCTPYAAQAKLIRKLLETEDFGSLVQVGTVHSFQGDERNAVVLELPEGCGGARMVGQFLQGVPPSHVGARLINVAISRTRNHLIVIANLTYLDPLLPSSALLRGVLYDMQQRGNVIRGSDLLALRPIESDLRGLLGHVKLDFDAETLGLFTGSTFDAAVEADIAAAKESVVFFSGFVTPGRVGKLGDLLRRKVLEGVKIRCITRPPHLNGTMDAGLGKQALDMLEGIKCTVDCRARIHQKVVLIDKEIVWHGSLNVLSHNHRNDESMTRVVNAGFAQAVAANMSKRHVSQEAALQAVANAENPRCGKCGNRSFYNEGRFGPFFQCEDKCGWSANLRSIERNLSGSKAAGHNHDLPIEGPACPVCKSKTRLRASQFGQFYGCVRFPKCSGKCPPPSLNSQGAPKRSSRKTSQASGL